MQVLGIDVSRETLLRWREWLMPPEQPFVVPAALGHELGIAGERPDPLTEQTRHASGRLTMEHRDAFWIYTIPEDHVVVWRDQAQARSLPTSIRRDQPERHHWPTADLDADLARIVRYVEDGRRTSRHGELGESDWREAATVLPYAKRIAGRFADGSGPNCFGAVMAASGVPGADSMWMQREPFEQWLAEHTVPDARRGSDEDPGTVLLWRSTDGLVQHAAVTLGRGYALHKPSQGWQSPTKVLTTQEVKWSARQAGHHLSRHRIG